MYSAYMIRNDGKEIPVKVHPYGNPENYEETLYASQWLYANTAHEETKKLVLTFIKSFAYEELGATSNIVNELKYWIENLPYVVLTDEFLDSTPQIEDAEVGDLASLNKMVCLELNQEFMRVRLGGMVNSSPNSKEIVFRISSTHFNWFNIIYMFVHNNKRNISGVTIVKDEEATGYENYYYKHKGEVYNNMPVEEFLSQSGNPVVESLDSPLEKSLQSGNSYLNSFGNVNYNRIIESKKRFDYAEIKNEVYVNG